MKIYIDSEFKCYTTNVGESLRSVETDYFDGKCDEFVEGYRFVPIGESWTREDGDVFRGMMVSAWKPYEELDQAQRQYERELAEAARILLGDVSV